MNREFYNYFKSFINRQFFTYPSYKMSTENMCHEAKEIFNAAVSSVKPENLINKAVVINQNSVEIQGKKFHIKKNAYVVGFGKAVLGMARALETKLKENIVSGIISIPEGLLNSSSINTYNDSSIQVYEGALNNIPDEKSLLAASKISELVASLKETDLLFVLISGGGSALLPAPKNSISLQEKQRVIKLLSSKGASIEELNAVRKKLSVLKGGGLAKLARPAKVISLILSDIVNDPLSSIASGPTVKNDDAPNLPLRIIEKYNLKKEIPISVLKVLENSQTDINENDSSFSHVNNFIIGSNKVALEAAASESQNLHYDSKILTDRLVGKANYTGMKLISMITAALHHEIELVYQICKELQFSENIPEMVLDFIAEHKIKDNKLCILLGGETTVEVTGTGLGGRNQELALASAIELSKNKPNKNIILLAAGTDGIDGPTTAAGAIATNFIVELAEEQGLHPVQFLNNNDSFNFYSRLKNGQFHVKTGHTGILDEAVSMRCASLTSKVPKQNR